MKIISNNSDGKLFIGNDKDQQEAIIVINTSQTGHSFKTIGYEMSGSTPDVFEFLTVNNFVFGDKRTYLRGQSVRIDNVDGELVVEFNRPKSSLVTTPAWATNPNISFGGTADFSGIGMESYVSAGNIRLPHSETADFGGGVGRSGQLFYENTENVLKYHNGTAMKTIATTDDIPVNSGTPTLEEVTTAGHTTTINTEFNSTGHLKISSGTTAERSAATDGYIRYNTDTTYFEMAGVHGTFDTSRWYNIAPMAFDDINFVHSLIMEPATANIGNPLTLGCNGTIQHDLGFLYLNDSLKFSAYGQGNIVQVPAYMLGVKANGEIVEVSTASPSLDEVTGVGATSTNPITIELDEDDTSTALTVTSGTNAGTDNIFLFKNFLASGNPNQLSMSANGVLELKSGQGIPFKISRPNGQALLTFRNDGQEGSITYWGNATARWAQGVVDDGSGNYLFKFGYNSSGSMQDLPSMDSQLHIYPSGQLQFNDYGSTTTITGTVNKYLAVDTDGKVIPADAVAATLSDVLNAGATYNGSATISITTDDDITLAPNDMYLNATNNLYINSTVVMNSGSVDVNATSGIDLDTTSGDIDRKSVV